MKLVILSALFILFTALPTQAQNQRCAEFAVVIGGKQFKCNEAVDKADLKDISSIEIIHISSGAHFRVTSFEWAISLKAENSIYKGGRGDESRMKYADLLAKMQADDLLFFDEFKTPGGGGLPQSFALRVK